MPDTTKPQTKLGIKETKEVVGFALDLGSRIKDALDDGRIDLGEALAIGFSIPGPLAKAIGGIAQVPAEIADLDDSEIVELSEMAAEKFGLNADVEKLIAAALRWVVSTIELVGAIPKKANKE